MSPWRVALLSTLGMLTTVVVVYRLTPQQALPPVPATPSPNEVSVADERPVTDRLAEPPVADELPLAPQPVTAVPNAPQRVKTRQRTAQAPLPAPPVITTPAPQSVTTAPNVTTQQPTAPAPPTIPLAVATAARADLAAPELGTLVAVAVGGSCEFSVDGQSITSSSTLRLTVPSGPHVVECGAHTRSVIVRTGETSMA
ncbi:hypothetical protein [Polyangium sp. 6x1]|uniref:hypothetical protein n=1 Tax=Polyangium sp. 6x1 TaxID=3042689 RepID=UPI00248241F6|nr:hypothetical protein [Polyangium sp. 6x1]